MLNVVMLEIVKIISMNSLKFFRFFVLQFWSLKLSNKSYLYVFCFYYNEAVFKSKSCGSRIFFYYVSLVYIFEKLF